MGAYSFNARFEPAIMADEKRHTIRDFRKDGRVPKVGEMLSLYVGQRTKACRLLKRRRCVRVQIVEINADKKVFVDYDMLTQDETDQLAVSDGFASFAEMMRFWDGRRPFAGHMIHWESDANTPTEAPQPHRPATGSVRRANTRRARQPASA